MAYSAIPAKFLGNPTGAFFDSDATSDAFQALWGSKDGCGRNDLVRELRRLGIDGLGVDFAFHEADLVRPMHATALQAGIADVVTSFDALEHLLPEDVDLTLAEMRRVAVPRGRFIFSICMRPSTTTVAGEGLHPTVRPLDWWLERIARVGVAGRPQAGSRYIIGRFKSDGGCCGA